MREKSPTIFFALSRCDILQDSLESYGIVFFLLALSLDLPFSMAKSDFHILHLYFQFS
jgi:hypothetical protein